LLTLMMSTRLGQARQEAFDNEKSANALEPNLLVCPISRPSKETGGRGKPSGDRSTHPYLQRAQELRAPSSLEGL
jgi:hypothetical protein